MDLGKDPLGKLILKLAIPAVIAQVVNLLYNLVDRMFVGRISGIGTDALAGLGICFPITLVASAFSRLAGMGGSPLASIKMGEGNLQEANILFNQSVCTLFFLGIILTIILIFAGDWLIDVFGCPASAFPYAQQYLRIYALGTIFITLSLGLNPFITAQGFSLIAMLTVLIGAILNIGLCPLFIYVFKMQVRGSALATVISQGVSAIWAFSFFFRKKSKLHYNIRHFIPSWSRLGRILLLGLSPFIMSATESAVQIVFNVTIRKYSHNNSAYSAALTIMLTAIQIISNPLSGLGSGVQPVVSYNYGSGDAERVKKSVIYCTIAALIFCVIVWVLSLAYPALYGYIFGVEPEVMVIIKKFTPIFMMGSIMFFAQMTLQSINVALNQAGISIFLACLRKIILLIPLCFLLPLAMGINGVFYSEGISDLVAGITTFVLFLVMFPRIMKKRKEELEKMRTMEINSYTQPLNSDQLVSNEA